MSPVANFANYDEPAYRIGSDKVMIGKTPVMVELFQNLNHLANLPTTVLLRAETGTGKELCALALHKNGSNDRRNQRFVAVNCAAIPSELLESELFGHAKGSFTGAYSDQVGKFEQANRGTIFLDEIGDMSLALQAKILRVLQEKEITRVGDYEPKKLDVRVIAATNKDLELEMHEKRFREDLFYRINVVPMYLPPLRERSDDIPLIAEHLITRNNTLYGANIEGLTQDAKDKLQAGAWRGNVRELENIIERAFVMRKEGLITPENLTFNTAPRRYTTTSLETQASSPTMEVRETEATTPTIDNGKKWYSDGVLATTPIELAKAEGALSYQSISRDLETLGIYFLKYGVTRIPKYSIIFLTPKTVSRLFKTTSTDAYKRLEEQISSNEFNEITRRPFAIMNLRMMGANPYLTSNDDTLKEAIRASGGHKIVTGRGNFFCLTAENSDYFITKGKRREQQKAGLQKYIEQEYQRFQNLRSSG